LGLNSCWNSCSRPAQKKAKQVTIALKRGKAHGLGSAARRQHAGQVVHWRYTHSRWARGSSPRPAGRGARPGEGHLGRHGLLHGASSSLGKASSPEQTIDVLAINWTMPGSPLVLHLVRHRVGEGQASSFNFAAIYESFHKIKTQYLHS
jgi:hypothetical protein